MAGELPERFRRLILMSRPDLLNRESVARLSNDGLLELASRYATDDIGPAPLAHEIVRARLLAQRTFNCSIPGQVISSRRPSRRLRSHELAPAWINVIGDNAAAIL